MKTRPFVLAALCAFASVASVASAEETEQILHSAPQIVEFHGVTGRQIPTETKSDALAKELADTKAALATSQQAQQSSAVAAEYYKAVAEKNDALLQLVQARGQVADLTKQLAEARAEVEALKTAAVTKKPEAKK